MAITLAGIQANLEDDIDFNTINELRMGSPFLLNAMPFDDVVVPGTNGGTLTAGYNRIASTRPAHTRQQNTEYPAFEATKRRVTVDLIPVGARYNIDRVFAKIGAASEVDFQQGQAVTATIAKFSDLFINGVAGADFSAATPEFEGLDAAVTGTITEWTDNGNPFDFDTITDKAGALAATRQLRAWLRKFDGAPSAFFVNDDGAAWLDQLNDWIGYYTAVGDSFGGEVATFRGIPYVNLGMKPGTVDEDDVLTGDVPEDDIIPTDENGVTSIYAARIGMDGVHGYATPGTLFSQWLPDFTTAGAVKPGEVELGPVAIAVKKTRAAGAFRVKVSA